jgi:hypothetical protein
VFDCETCPRRLQREALSEHDIATLDAYQLLRLPVVADLRLAPLVFDALDLRLTRAEARLLLEKLNVIHADAVAARETTRPAGDED